MKASAVLALASAAAASAYSVDRSTLRSLGQKSIGGARPRARSNKHDMKMEDFGFLKGTGIGFDDLWSFEGNDVISEVGLEKALNKEGLRYKMNKTPEEAAELGPLFGLPGITLNLPIIGETWLGPPRDKESIWEALGFTATSNNEARQNEKIRAIEKAKTAKKGVRLEAGASQRAEWLEKYGYPRLVGSGGIFYADQLSTDREAMGGFNMGKSGSIWPVPDVVREGQYGGAKGWGMKKRGTAVDGLEKVTDPEQ